MDTKTNNIRVKKNILEAVAAGISFAIIFLFLWYFWFRQPEQGIINYVQKYEVRTFGIAGGFGFEIYVNDTLLVKQDFDLNSQDGGAFSSEKDAINAGLEMVDNIEKGNDLSKKPVDEETMNALESNYKYGERKEDFN